MMTGKPINNVGNLMWVEISSQMKKVEITIACNYTQKR